MKLNQEDVVYAVFSKSNTDPEVYDLDLEIIFHNKPDADEWVATQTHPSLYVVKQMPVCKIDRSSGRIDLRKNISLNDMPQEIREQFD